MGNDHKDRFIDAGMAESEQYEPDEEVAQEFADAQRLSGNLHFRREPRNPEDVEEELARQEMIEEAASGFSALPDQDAVDELGGAIGLTYEDNEPLHTTDKVEQRDRHRWELDPASSEDYKRRVNHEGE